MQHEYSPHSGDGKASNSAVDPSTGSPDGQLAISTLLDREAYTTNDALDLLHEAAQRGTSDTATENSTDSVQESETESRVQAVGIHHPPRPNLGKIEAQLILR